VLDLLLMGFLILWLIACAALVTGIALFDRWRWARIFRRILNQPLDRQKRGAPSVPVRKHLEPECQFIVRLSDQEVVCERPDGKVERISWSELQKVEIVTTSEGPMVADVFWVLHGLNRGCAIPQGATGEKELLERLQKLPNFDNGAVIEAMGCTSDRRFLCWEKRG